MGRNHDQLLEVWRSVWETQFSLQLEATALEESTESMIYAGVQVHGQYSAELRLRCSSALIRKLAARLLDCEADSLSEDALDDLVAEIANIAAGNLRSVFSCGNGLHTPEILTAEEFSIPEHVRATLRVDGTIDGHSVSLLWITPEHDLALS